MITILATVMVVTLAVGLLLITTYLYAKWIVAIIDLLDGKE